MRTNQLYKMVSCNRSGGLKLVTRDLVAELMVVSGVKAVSPDYKSLPL